MATVSPLPFAIAIVGAMGLLAAWLDLAIAESRRPLRSRAFARGDAAGRVPAPALTAHPVPLPAPPQPSRPERTRPPRVRIAPVRIAVLVGAFVLWSVWSSARRPHAGTDNDARRHH